MKEDASLRALSANYSTHSNYIQLPQNLPRMLSD
jgi:hypothetical protein